MSFSRSSGLLAVGVACVLVIPVTQADIYRWVNEDGSVVYSDSPPTDRNRVTDVFVSDKSAPSAPPAPSPSLEMQALTRMVEQLRDDLAEERRARWAADSAGATAATGCARGVGRVRPELCRLFLAGGEALFSRHRDHFDAVRAPRASWPSPLSWRSECAAPALQTGSAAAVVLWRSPARSADTAGIPFRAGQFSAALKRPARVR